MSALVLIVGMLAASLLLAQPARRRLRRERLRWMYRQLADNIRATVVAIGTAFIPAVKAAGEAMGRFAAALAAASGSGRTTETPQ